MCDPDGFRGDRKRPAAPAPPASSIASAALPPAAPCCAALPAPAAAAAAPLLAHAAAGASERVLAAAPERRPAATAPLVNGPSPSPCGCCSSAPSSTSHGGSLRGLDPGWGRGVRACRPNQRSPPRGAPPSSSAPWPSPPPCAASDEARPLPFCRFRAALQPPARPAAPLPPASAASRALFMGLEGPLASSSLATGSAAVPFRPLRAVLRGLLALA